MRSFDHDSYFDFFPDAPGLLHGLQGVPTRAQGSKYPTILEWYLPTNHASTEALPVNIADRSILQVLGPCLTWTWNFV